MRNQFLALATLITLGLGSCKPDACKDVTCLNGGICDSGDCVCATGYAGTNCDTEQRSVFVGNYSAVENCNLGDFNYEISINANSENVTEIVLHNLGDFNFDIVGVVSGTAVTFTDQPGTGSTINGTGTLDNGVLTIDYTLVTSGDQTLTCNLTATIIE
ncbi:MAG: hypothetical protein KBF73_13340 [Flavobacteriales bacterium]|nr:hypothetical protein [Flavobacteriales bacterium]